MSSKKQFFLIIHLWSFLSNVLFQTFIHSFFSSKFAKLFLQRTNIESSNSFPKTTNSPIYMFVIQVTCQSFDFSFILHAKKKIILYLQRRIKVLSKKCFFFKWITLKLRVSDVWQIPVGQTMHWQNFKNRFICTYYKFKKIHIRSKDYVEPEVYSSILNLY